MEPNTNKIPVIMYPRFETLRNKIELCQQMTYQMGEPRCISLEGVTGTGKSTLARHYAANYPAVEDETGTRKPVFIVPTPAKTTVRNFTETMLSQLGDPAAKLRLSVSGSQARLDDRLDGLICDCGVKLVIVDDFQHLLNIDTDHQRKAVSDWLKVRIKNTGVTFVIVGIPGQIERVLDFNPQLSRLFAMREKLDPFVVSLNLSSQWKRSDEESFGEMDYFVRCIEQLLKLDFCPSVDRVDLLQRIYKATGGVAANIVLLLQFAKGLQPGLETADYKVLEKAFDYTLHHHIKLDKNPFSTKGARKNATS